MVEFIIAVFMREFVAAPSAASVGSFAFHSTPLGTRSATA